MSLDSIYDAGYAVRTYNINNNVQDWQFRQERFKTSDLATEELLGFTVVRIEDLRRYVAR